MNPILYFLRDLKKTGAVAPSSKYLAKDITAILRQQILLQQKPLHILELGPGTGRLTQAISSAIRPKDQLDLVEINPHFTRLLRKKFPTSNIQVYFADFLDFSPEYRYDYIFSSIPYETIPEKISRQIWEKKLDCCTEGGKITYYKYFNFNHFRSKFEKKLVRQYCIDQKLVFRNLPPAKLFTLEVATNGKAASFEENRISA